MNGNEQEEDGIEDEDDLISMNNVTRKFEFPQKERNKGHKKRDKKYSLKGGIRHNDPERVGLVGGGGESSGKSGTKSKTLNHQTSLHHSSLPKDVENSGITINGVDGSTIKVRPRSPRKRQSSRKQTFLRKSTHKTSIEPSREASKKRASVLQNNGKFPVSRMVKSKMATYYNQALTEEEKVSFRIQKAHEEKGRMICRVLCFYFFTFLVFLVSISLALYFVEEYSFTVSSQFSLDHMTRLGRTPKTIKVVFNLMYESLSSYELPLKVDGEDIYPRMLDSGYNYIGILKMTTDFPYLFRSYKALFNNLMFINICRFYFKEVEKVGECGEELYDTGLETNSVWVLENTRGVLNSMNALKGDKVKIEELIRSRELKHLGKISDFLKIFEFLQFLDLNDVESIWMAFGNSKEL